MDKNGAAGRRYSADDKAAAVLTATTLRVQLGTDRGTAQRVALQLRYGVESVRVWVRNAAIDDGLMGGVASDGDAVVFVDANKNVDVEGRNPGAELICKVLRVAPSI